MIPNNPTTTPALSVRGISKKYGNIPAISSLNFEIQPGEIVGLLGRNGAGKTTTIEGILGLRTLDCGEISIDGTDALKHPLQTKQKLGAQLQTITLPDAMTPHQALDMMGAFYSDSTDPDELLQRFTLQEKAHVSFHTLSAGQKQRLSLALAFVNQPKLLLLDEPSAGLDANLRSSLQKLLMSAKEQGCAILMSTHLIDEAEKICDRILLLENGEIIASGTPSELISQSATLSRIVVQTKDPIDKETLNSLKGVTAMETQQSQLTLSTTDPDSILLELVQLLIEQHHSIEHLDVRKPTLESAYLTLTGKPWKDTLS